MKTFFKRFVFLGVFLSMAMSFVACQSQVKEPSAYWSNDYEETREKAAKENKNILIFFSGEDWDTYSTGLKDSIFYTKDFVDNLSKEYELVHLDFSESLYSQAEVAEDATEEEKAKAEELQAKLIEDTTVANNFLVNSMPTVLLVSPAGYVYGAIPYDESVTTVAQYVEQINGYKEAGEKVASLTKELETKTGVDKIAVIDGLFETVLPSHQSLLRDLAAEVPSLDPDNVSGRRGEYEVINAYNKSYEAIMGMDVLGAVDILLEPIDSGYLTTAQKQELYYQAAYFYYMLGADYSENMMSLLKTGYNLDPASEIATTIKMTMDQLQAIMDAEKTNTGDEN